MLFWLCLTAAPQLPQGYNTAPGGALGGILIPSLCQLVIVICHCKLQVMNEICAMIILRKLCINRNEQKVFAIEILLKYKN